MTIALFADVHGRILLCFYLCARWEQETGKTIDLILQAGDLAAFPDRTRLDRATRQHSVSDPTVLGFADHFTAVHPEVATLLGMTRCPFIFVRGNHEDQVWLDTLERRAAGPLFPIDAYQRIFCLKTGVPYAFTRNDETLHLLGIGRIGRPEGSQRQKPHYLQPYEQERLARPGEGPIDLLLTHDAARDEVFPGSGSEAVSSILEQYRPCYHFFGHYGGGPRQFITANRQTQSWLLADLLWESMDRKEQLKPGAMGILQWRTHEAHQFELVDLEALR